METIASTKKDRGLQKPHISQKKKKSPDNQPDNTAKGRVPKLRAAHRVLNRASTVSQLMDLRQKLNQSSVDLVLQRTMSVGGKEITSLDEIPDTIEVAPYIRKLWGKWIGQTRHDFRNWDEARNSAFFHMNLTEEDKISPKTAKADAGLLASTLGTAGSKKFLENIGNNEEGIIAHYHEMRRYALAGTLNDLEHRFEPGPYDRFADILAQEGPKTVHVEVKDYAASKEEPSGGQGKHFQDQLFDNISYMEQLAMGGHKFEQRYVFAQGVPRWAYEIMTGAFRRFVGTRAPYGWRLITNLYNLRGVGENIGRTEITFYLEPDFMVEGISSAQNRERWRSGQAVDVSSESTASLKEALIRLGKIYYINRGSWDHSIMDKDISDEIDYLLTLLSSAHGMNALALVDPSME